MKLSRLLILVNIVLIFFAAIIAIPSIDMKLFGKELKFDNSIVKSLFNSQFKNITFDNSRDFMRQQLFVLDMTGLNTTPAEGETGLSKEEKELILNNNFDIIKKRIGYMGMGDYDMRKIVTAEGKYFIEVKLPENEINGSVLGSLISEGEYRFYEYDENYKKPENPDEAPFSFLDGKKPSELLNLGDAIRIQDYFNSQIQPSGGWTIKIDFGDINADKVALAAAGPDNITDIYRRLWIVQGEVPVAIQFEPVLKDVSNQPVQSEIVFTSFISQDDPNSRLITNALTSSLKTEAINTPIIISSAQYLEPVYGTNTIEMIKVFSLLAFVGIVVVSMVAFKTRGIVLAIALGVHSLLTIVLAKLVSSSITVGLILGMTAGLTFFVFTIADYLIIKKKDLIKEFDEFRKNYWLVAALILVCGVVSAMMLDALLLAGILGFVISLIASLITYELTLKTLIEIFKK